MKDKKSVVVLDFHRGIYWGYLVEELDGGNAVRLDGGRHCFYYGVGKDKGTYSLATVGPSNDSKIGPRVNMKIMDVSKIIDCTDEATEAWEKATW